MVERDGGERRDATERRVYNLPADLLERLRAYQVSQGIASEAEAARRLLDSALQMRDTVSDILNTLEARFADERDLRVLASDVLIKHALVENVTIKEREIQFRLVTNERGSITHDGKLKYSDSPFGDDDWVSYKGKSKSAPKNVWNAVKGGDLDDEIPF